MNHASKRAIMTFLFTIALFSTWHALTGVGIPELRDYVYDQMSEQSSYVSEEVAEIKREPEEKNWPVQAMGSLTDQQGQLDPSLGISDYPSKQVEATGYTAGVESTGKKEGDPGYGITYSGVPVQRDVYSTIAADPEVFPIGTILFVPDYGFAVVADTGSAIEGDIIDLYYETVDDVFDQWGKQEVEVYVIEEGDGTLDEEKVEQLNERYDAVG
ncbi:3D domain-containing protein [Salsuginibacillus kocurii]|uniref:3D domain-containing protein n=1 Tax=Salsuginibacillus kocurii TaxID=427078 RepID=UPI000379EC14|nr:3D domain-containing protein [Salsuginibacillus kocurii]